MQPSNLERELKRYDFLESQAVLSAFRRLLPAVSLSELIKIRFHDHTSFLSNPRSFDEVFSRGYVAMRQISSGIGLVLDDLIVSNIKSTIPNPFRVDDLAPQGHELFGSAFNLTDITQSIKESGYYIFPTPLRNDVLQALQSLFSKTTPDASSGRVDANEEATSSDIDLLRFALSKIFLNIAGNYLEVCPILDSIILGRSSVSVALSEQSLSANAMTWHYDKDRTSFIKFFVYLNDVDASNGPHQYIQGTRNIAHEHASPDLRIGSRLVYEKFPFESINTISGPAGTMFVADTHTIHRGLPPIERERHLLQFQYSSSLFGAPFSHLPTSVIERDELLILAREYPRVFSRYRA